jgi:hypothetical protein
MIIVIIIMIDRFVRRSEKQHWMNRWIVSCETRISSTIKLLWISFDPCDLIFQGTISLEPNLDVEIRIL